MQELEQIPALLQQLTTSKVAAAEKKLIAVSSSEEAIQYMVRMLDDPSLTQQIQQLAASHIARMLIDYPNIFPAEFSENLILNITANLDLPFSAKKMLATCLRQFARLSTSFLQGLLELTEEVLTSITSTTSQEANNIQVNSLVNDFKTLFSFKVNNENELLHGCETIIIIGEAILPLIIRSNPKKEQEAEEEQQIVESSVVENVLKFMQYCESLHALIFNETNLRKYPHLFLKLFNLYALMTEQGVNPESVHQCLIKLSLWENIPTDIKLIYSLGSHHQQSFFNGEQMDSQIEELIEATSNFHSALMKHILSTFYPPHAQSMLRQFIRPIRASLIHYDARSPQVFIQNWAILLRCYYESYSEIDIAEMMQIFQETMVPLITHIISVDELQLFSKFPGQMYNKLSQIIQGSYDSDYILVSLSSTIKHFINLSQDFYLYLFQFFRYSIERQLHCHKDDWSPPEYLINAHPLNLCTVFYLMSIIPYCNRISEEIMAYLREVITGALVDQLGAMEKALFYLFLEGAYLQLYDDNIDGGLFLMTHIFKSSVDSSSSSSIFFVYQFIYHISDYYINKEYIIQYARSLPRLQEFDVKWNNVFNWLTYLQDFNQEFVTELFAVIHTHIHQEIPISEQEQTDRQQINYEQLNKYFEILITIAKNKNFLNKKVKLQRILLEQYTQCQDMMNSKTEESFYSLLAALLSFFKYHKPIFLQILPILLSKHASHRSQVSTAYYYLLAEYIYHVKSKDVVMAIFAYLENACLDVLKIAGMNQKEREKALVNIGNILIIFQNMLMRHRAILDCEVIHHMMVRCKQIKKIMYKNLPNFYQKLQGFTVISRCLNLQLVFFAFTDQQPKNYKEYFFAASNNLFKNYDGRLFVEMLNWINLKLTPATRKDILIIAKAILDMSLEDFTSPQYEKQMNDLFDLPNKMTPAIDMYSTIFRQIRKLFIFFQIPDWHRIHRFVDNVSKDFVVQLEKQYKVVEKSQRKAERDEVDPMCEYILMIEQRKQKYLKRRRTPADDEFIDVDGPQKQIKRRSMYESFRKRLKRDNDMLPQDKPQQPKNKQSSQSESNEEIEAKKAEDGEGVIPSITQVDDNHNDTPKEPEVENASEDEKDF